MTGNKPARFILVDDDPLCNLLTGSMLRRICNGCDVIEFTEPAAALENIKATYGQQGYYQPTVIFLDINMPLISGWDFMQLFETFEPRIIGQFTIYILSSSLDNVDKQKARDNKHIEAFLNKPLRRLTIEDIFSHAHASARV